jgi:hypothetical protein
MDVQSTIKQQMCKYCQHWLFSHDLGLKYFSVLTMTFLEKETRWCRSHEYLFLLRCRVQRRGGADFFLLALDYMRD